VTSDQLNFAVEGDRLFVEKFPLPPPGERDPETPGVGGESFSGGFPSEDGCGLDPGHHPPAPCPAKSFEDFIEGARAGDPGID